MIKEYKKGQNYLFDFQSDAEILFLKIIDQVFEENKLRFELSEKEKDVDFVDVFLDLERCELFFYRKNDLHRSLLFIETVPCECFVDFNNDKNKMELLRSKLKFAIFSDETINRFFKLRIDVINAGSDKEKLKLLKLLKKRAVNEIKKLAYCYTSINLHDFDPESPFSDNWLTKSYYRILYCYISDSLSAYSSELRKLNLSNLSFYNRILVRRELKRMERYGYFSKRKYIPKPFIISGVGYLIEG